MAYIKPALTLHLEFEGGWGDHPQDLGKETYRGISRHYHPTWEGWELIDAAKRKAGFPNNLENDKNLQNLVEDFYLRNFWRPMRLEAVSSQAVANEMFDAGAGPNGMGIAVRIAQGALILLGRDIKFDGQMGPNTLAALNSYPHPHVLVKLMNHLQFAHFLLGSANIEDTVDKIRKRLPLLKTFIKGWLKRV